MRINLRHELSKLRREVSNAPPILKLLGFHNMLLIYLGFTWSMVSQWHPSHLATILPILFVGIAILFVPIKIYNMRAEIKFLRRGSYIDRKLEPILPFVAVGISYSIATIFSMVFYYRFYLDFSAP